MKGQGAYEAGVELWRQTCCLEITRSDDDQLLQATTSPVSRSSNSLPPAALASKASRAFSHSSTRLAIGQAWGIREMMTVATVPKGELLELAVLGRGYEVRRRRQPQAGLRLPQAAPP